MSAEIQIAGLDITNAISQETSCRLLERYGLRLIRDLPTLHACLLGKQSPAPDGVLLVVPRSLFYANPEVGTWILQGRADSGFGMIILEDRASVPETEPEGQNVVKLPVETWLIESNVSRLVGDIAAQTDQIWVQDAIQFLYDAYEHLHVDTSISNARPHEFLKIVRKRVAAKSVRVYRCPYPSQDFKLYLYDGEASSIPAMPFDLVSASIQVSAPCRTQSFAEDDSASDLGFLDLRSNTELAIASSFELDGVPFLVLYNFGNSDNREPLTEVCNFASREVGHAIRGSRIRQRYSTLAHLSSILRESTSEESMYWRALEIIKLHYGADGCSIIELLAAEPSGYSFRKYFVHYGRHEVEDFGADHGYAVEAIIKRKALLIRDTDRNSTHPTGIGVEFDPASLSSDQGRDTVVPYITTLRTIEHEESLMYFPLQIEGASIGGLKVASFHVADSFDLGDLRDLSVFAGAVESLMLHGRLRSELTEKQRNLAVQEKMREQAEKLFFYREIALGVFHQLGNHIASVRGSLSVLEGALSSVSLPSRAPLEYLQKAIEYANLSRELINDAHKRGLAMKPLPRPGRIVQDVVRPAIEYAEGRLRGTEIRVRHTLTADDYPVWLDVKLAREGLINLLTNAIWAIKSNKGAGKKEIFVVVRHQDGTIRIDVTDSGIGMQKEIYEDVAKFMPFVSFREGGTGLGLYFTHRLLTEFGGTISIPWSQYQKGTTVSITVPVHADQEKKA